MCYFMLFVCGYWYFDLLSSCCFFMVWYFCVYTLCFTCLLSCFGCLLHRLFDLKFCGGVCCVCRCLVGAWFCLCFADFPCCLLWFIVFCLFVFVCLLFILNLLCWDLCGIVYFVIYFVWVWFDFCLLFSCVA